MSSRQSWRAASSARCSDSRFGQLGDGPCFLALQEINLDPLSAGADLAAQRLVDEGHGATGQGEGCRRCPVVVRRCGPEQIRLPLAGREAVEALGQDSAFASGRFLGGHRAGQGDQ